LGRNATPGQDGFTYRGDRRSDRAADGSNRFSRIPTVKSLQKPFDFQVKPQN